MSENFRHPGEGRDIIPSGEAPNRARSRIKSGMTVVAVLALAACAAYAQDGAPDATPGDAPQTEAAPAQPPPGPPPMPRPVTMVDRPNATGGEVLYVQHCIMCHGPNGMGTGLLARRMEVAELEQRDNLPAAYVVQAARRGIGNMPAIPRGEVSDEELQLIAEYLAAGAH
jgi:mono/diheme cytochrome c family protein